MSGKFYVLDGKTPKAVDSLEEWAKHGESAHCHVADEMVGAVRVSTVFLGVDHSHGYGPPLVFETMIFGGPHDQHQTRASTWDDAEKQHAEAVAVARSGLN
jgi:hypothetical protein